MSMPNKATSAKMKPMKKVMTKKVEKATRPPVTKKKTASTKSVPKVVSLRGKAYVNGAA